MRMGKWTSRSVFSLFSHFFPILACRYYYGVRGEKIECWDEEKHQGEGTSVPLSVNGELFTGVIFNQSNKDVRYYQNSHIHREDGPAVEGADGRKEWYVDGQKIDILAVFGYQPSVPLNTEEQMILRLSV